MNTLKSSIVLLAFFAALSSSAQQDRAKAGVDGLSLLQLRTLAINGSPYYQAALSSACRYGDLGESSDYASAASWAQESAAAKNPLGLYALAALSDGGLGIQADKAKAEELFKEAAPGLEKMADDGDYRACYAYAYLCYSGRGGVPQSKEKAATLFLKAAEAGDLHASYMAGTLYLRGEGVEQSNPKAIEWLQKAALAGERSAQRALGMLYLKTAKIGRNKDEGAKWIVMAAEGGDAEAQYIAGGLFEGGLTGKKDMKRALQYYHRSALQGNEAAKKRLKSFADEMRKTLGIEKAADGVPSESASPDSGAKAEAVPSEGVKSDSGSARDDAAR